MKKLTPASLCQVYVIALLLVVAVLSPFQYTLLDLVMLLAWLCFAIRPVPTRQRLVTTVLSVFLLPQLVLPVLGYLTDTVALSPGTVRAIALLSDLPIIYLVDRFLLLSAKASASDAEEGRHLTATSRALLMTAVAIMILAGIVGNSTLLFTALLFAAYLLVALTATALKLSRTPTEVSPIHRRVIAGTTLDLIIAIKSRSAMPLLVSLKSGEGWGRLRPGLLSLTRDKTEVSFTVTPPLSGPSRPRIQASILDPRGLIETGQRLEPVELEVIPRARYAEWLAARYLEQTATGTSTASAEPVRSQIKPKRGTEYYESRTYQPGDALRNIDWKHTVKLNRLIVKDYIEAGSQSAIIALNLTVASAEEADELAFTLITAAMTLAQESIPTALAVYNHKDVIMTTAPIGPQEALKQAISLVRSITLAEPSHHFLAMPNIPGLRRNIGQLKRATSAPAGHLLDMLRLEYDAIEKSVQKHPATLALTHAARLTSPPAMVLLISEMNHDAEALLMTAEKLSRREFTTITLDGDVKLLSRIRLPKAKPHSTPL